MPNIVNDYTWTATTGSYKEECPRIFAKTFEPLNSDIYNNLANWVKSIQPGRQYKEYYNDLHSTVRKDEWVFPYFSDTARSFTNEWGDQRVDSTSSKVTGLLAQYFEANVGNPVANAVASMQEIGASLGGIFQQSNNSMLLEPPKFYQYGNSDTDVVIEFPLINTINPSEDISKNYKLVYKLIEENRFQRLGGAATKSPFLWSIVIPGYRSIRWASCNVDVTFVGNRKYKDNKIVPEGYRVKLTFKSLYTEPRNFMADVGGESLE